MVNKKQSKLVRIRFKADALTFDSILSQTGQDQSVPKASLHCCWIVTMWLLVHSE